MKVTRQPRTVRLDTRNRITIPRGALTEAGLHAGDRLEVRADGIGRLIAIRQPDAVDEVAGTLTGTYRPKHLGALRDEWR